MVKYLLIILIGMTACFPLRKITCQCNGTLNDNLNGVYSTQETESGRREIFIFYKDGSILFPGYYISNSDLEKIGERNYSIDNDTKINKKKWGCYTVSNNHIKIQRFYESKGGGYNVQLIEGNILSDSKLFLKKAIKSNENIIVNDTLILMNVLKPENKNWLLEKKCE